MRLSPCLSCDADAYRLVNKGLKKTGKVVYDFGMAAENMTAEATEVRH